MASQNQNKNMTVASASGRSSKSNTHKHTDSQGSGNDSDASSFSADFNEIDATREFVSGRLGEASFGDRKGVSASIRKGEIFADEIVWEDDTEEVTLTWVSACNLAGEEGIADSEGNGWTEWDDDEECYTRKSGDDTICMQIIEIDIVKAKKSKVKKAPTVSASHPLPVNDKLVRKAERTARKAARAAKKDAEAKESDNSDATQLTEPMVCACGKEMAEITEHGTPLCKKHLKKHLKKEAVAKEVEVEKVKSAIESGLNSGSASDDSDDAEKKPTCSHEFARGENKGSMCGKAVSTDSTMCTKHAVAAAKKAGKSTEAGKGKIEISKRQEDKTSDMASTTMIKNMSEILSVVLGEILSSALKDKYAAKAIAALATDEAQTKLQQVIKDNMTTKVVKTDTTRKRKKKDPAAPKRGCSSYIHACKVMRAEIKEEEPDMKGVEVTREMGRRWKLMSDDDKKPYEKAAKKDKKRYEKEMNDYTPSAEWLAEAAAAASESDSDGDKKKGKKGTGKKRKPGPKRARSAYIFFCSEMRSIVKENNDDMDAKEVTAELGRIWREEVKEDKKKSKKYNKEAKKDKARYEEEKAAWVDPERSVEESEFAPSAKGKAVTSDDESDAEEEKSSKKEKKSSKKKEKKSSKKKVTMAPTAFTIYCQKTRESLRAENPEWPMRKVTREMEKMWAGMDADEKTEYC